MTASQGQLQLRRVDEIHELHLNESLQAIHRNQDHLNSLIEKFSDKEAIILRGDDKLLSQLALAVVQSILIRSETKRILNHDSQE